MLTRNEIERLASAIHGLRPEWPVASLTTFIEMRKARPLLDLSLELTWVAQLPETRTPKRIDEDGPWKNVAGQTFTPANLYRAPTGLDCAICSLPEPDCRRRPGDHEFDPRPAEKATPPDELKALISNRNAPTDQEATNAPGL